MENYSRHSEVSIVDAADETFQKALKCEGLPSPDLGNLNQAYFSLIHLGEVVGYIGIELYETHGLLRSLVVLPQFKGQGYGRRLVDLIGEQFGPIGVTELWLLTTTAKSFFEKLGWQVRDRADAPLDILKSDEFTSACPASATCMAIGLSEHS